MPVDDRPVHPVTVQKPGAVYGCHSARRPTGIAPGYWVEVRKYDTDGTFWRTLQFVPHIMSTACMHSVSYTDPQCAGCAQC